MIRNSKYLQKEEDKIIKNSKANFKKNLKILNALYKEAKLLGKFKSKKRLSGIERVIRIAKVINSV